MTADASGRWANRSESALVLVLAVGILTLAAVLSPKLEGYGTQQHLLPVPCLFRSLTHLPCPFCGLTTSYAAMARLRVGQAFASHPSGPPCYLLTWLVGGRALYALVRGDPFAPAWLRGKRATVVLLALLGVGWLINLVRVLVA